MTRPNAKVMYDYEAPTPEGRTRRRRSTQIVLAVATVAVVFGLGFIACLWSSETSSLLTQALANAGWSSPDLLADDGSGQLRRRSWHGHDHGHDHGPSGGNANNGSGLEGGSCHGNRHRRTIPREQLIGDTQRYLLSNRDFDINTPPTTRYFEWTISEALAAPGGMAKPMIVVNGMSPGPILEANLGDRLIITVHNRLCNETAIHWHGMLQRDSNFMDGTYSLNQCGIPPGGSMTYDWTVQNTGTSWYHAHRLLQYTDGLYGAMILHDPNERAMKNNAYDDEYTFLLNDMYNTPSFALLQRFMEPGEGIDGAPGDEPTPDGGMINGVSQAMCAYTPASDHVKPGGPAPGNGEGTGTATDGPPSGAPSGVGHEAETATFTETPTSVPTSTGDHSSEDGSSAPAPSPTDDHPLEDGPSAPTPTGDHSSEGASPTAVPTGTEGPPEPDGPKHPETNECGDLPTDYFKVDLEGGKTYRLRLVNSGSLAPITFSIDHHKFTVIEADGSSVVPYPADSINMAIGQRYSVLVTLDQPQGAYWIRNEIETEGLFYKGPKFNETTLGVLRYSGCNENQLPEDSPRAANHTSEATTVGPRTVLTEADPQEAPPATRTEYITFGPNTNAAGVNLMFMNNNSWSPLPPGEAAIWRINASNAGDPGALSKIGNELQVVNEEAGVMDIVLNSNDGGDHPFHLHGHIFWVLSQGDQPFTGPTDGLNTTNPPRRDTVVVPANGHVVIRFQTDNPGIWPFHCHIGWHMEAGLLMTIINLPGEIAKWDQPELRAMCRAAAARVW